ncbi:MAG TPA: DUF6580 family putative transport protein [Candidatus Methylacidiphilales bacterium]
MTPRFATLALLVLAAAAARLAPHPDNFTPVAAMALFGGARFADKRAAFLVPLAAMVLSDCVLGFTAVAPFVYGAFALTVLLGFALREKGGIARLAGAGIAAAVLFFVVTNGAVWLVSGLYPKTAAGFVDCLIAGVPFFRNTLLGTLAYEAVLFGGFALAERRFPALRRALRTPAVVAA